MKREEFINPSRVISANILEPYENSGEAHDYTMSRGWQVSFFVGYRDGYPDFITVDKGTREECLELIEKLELIKL